MNINGSFILAKTDDREVLVKLLKGDVYAREEVWNFEKMIIIPV